MDEALFFPQSSNLPVRPGENNLVFLRPYVLHLWTGEKFCKYRLKRLFNSWTLSRCFGILKRKVPGKGKGQITTFLLFKIQRCNLEKLLEVWSPVSLIYPASNINTFISLWLTFQLSFLTPQENLLKLVHVFLLITAVCHFRKKRKN